jgi:membrane associated rhomboid family serine protease
MIPISDDNPTFRTPVMTLAILAVTWGVWLFGQHALDGVLGTYGTNGLALAASVCDWGMVPGELTHRAAVGLALPIGPGLYCVVDNDAKNWLTPLTMIFLHGSWGHIAGNSLYLWVFGNNIEDSMGRWKFLAFYLLCGLAAAATHVALSPSSPVPTVGASGAISGVMGAYLYLYPRVRVRTYFPPIFLFRLPAWSILILWFAMQVLTGLPQLMTLDPAVSGGVAVWAHVGGFVAGLLLIRTFHDPALLRRRTTRADAQVVWH